MLDGQQYLLVAVGDTLRYAIYVERSLKSLTRTRSPQCLTPDVNSESSPSRGCRRPRSSDAADSIFGAFAQAKPNSLINGVQIGTITYSYPQMPDQSAEATLKYILDSGISAIELMGGPVESFAGAPASPDAAAAPGAVPAARAAARGRRRRRRAVRQAAARREDGRLERRQPA